MIRQVGIESRTSTIRIMMPSTTPPTSPATAPQSVLIRVAMIAERRPISSDAWPPIMIRPRTSKPLASVPSGCPLPGGRSLSSEVRGDLVGVVEVRAEEAEQDEEDHHPDPDQRELVLRERLQRHPEPPPWVVDLAALVLGDEDRISRPVTPGAIVTASPGSCQPDPRVGEGERDVGDQVADHDEDPADQGVAEQDRVVLGTEAVEEQQAEPRVVEDLLGDQVAGRAGPGSTARSG